MFATNQTWKMNSKTHIGFAVLICLVLTALASCDKKVPESDNPVAGHWGCWRYVSHRTDSAGHDLWDTLDFEVHEGCAYEIFLYDSGKGQLRLNESPAFINAFTCTYHYDSLTHVMRVESSSWLYALYGMAFPEADQVSFAVETLTDSTLVASWTNHLAEPKPFLERFFLKRID